MEKLTVQKILEVTKGELISGKKDLICENFSKDTRTIQKGDIYIGIKGEKFDGSQFWKQALENGAECAIISNIEIKPEEIEKYKNKTIIKVSDTLEALYEIAKAKRELYQIPVIGITGSVGKTSTKDIVANVVSQKYKTLKTIGNNNNNIGLPFTILRLKDEEALVVEMGMNHFGEISLLSKIAKPNICIITNIGTSHIGNLGSRENILKAKLEILEGAENPTVIINNDNNLLHKWYEENKEKTKIDTYESKEKNKIDTCENKEKNKIDNYENIGKIYTYGIKEKSYINAKDIILKDENSEFICNINQESTKVHVPVGGEHFVLNALCAALVGEILEIDTHKIVEGIENFELTKKRMDITEKDGIKIINDAYNASLESMKASLKYLSDLEGKRKIAILGDMFELGEYSQKLHEEVGTAVYENNIDILICSGEDAKYMAKQAEEAGMEKSNIYYLKDREEIVKKVKEIMQQGDCILIKASNATKFYELAEKIS